MFSFQPWGYLGNSKKRNVLRGCANWGVGRILSFTSRRVHVKASRPASNLASHMSRDTIQGCLRWGISKRRAVAAQILRQTVSGCSYRKSKCEVSNLRRNQLAKHHDKSLSLHHSPLWLPFTRQQYQSSLFHHKQLLKKLLLQKHASTRSKRAIVWWHDSRSLALITLCI